MRYTKLRGLQKLKMQVALTFACMNLKKPATWKCREGLLIRFFYLKMAPYALRKVPFLSAV